MSASRSPAPLTRTAQLLAGAFTVSGVIHLVRPETFEAAMPRWVPAHRRVIVSSGWAELACAAGLAVPRTRRAAGYASAALLAGVFPANLQMAADAMRGDSRALKAATLARLPLQAPMIKAALDAARRA